MALIGKQPTNSLVLCLLLLLASCSSNQVGCQTNKANPSNNSEIADDDLDNSIGGQKTDVGGQQRQSWPTASGTDLTGAQSVLAAGGEQLPINRIAELPAALAKLEHRLDWLEFELRKSLHQQQQMTVLLLRSNGGQLDRMAGPQSRHESNGGQQAKEDPNTPPTPLQLEPNNKWILMPERLELMEKLITVTTKKLYETEQRVKHLERCDCKQSCRWRPAVSSQPDRGRQNRADSASHDDNDDDGDGASTDDDSMRTTNLATNAHINDNQQQIDNSRSPAANKTSDRPPVQVKQDGQVWENDCDVCSCHRGHVRCRHRSCPEPKCAKPQYVAGKCCPVCYKSCHYRSQTLEHGRKLVINSGQDTCKECLCMDGRLRCQRRIGSFTDNGGGGQTGAAPISRRARSSRRTWDPYSEFELPENLPNEIQSDQVNEEDDDEQLIDEDLERPRRRGRRSGAHLAAPTVCPQMDCKPEERIKLRNDCCTYCKGFDFCNLQLPTSGHNNKWLNHLQCDQNAFCINLNTNSSALIGDDTSSNESAGDALDRLASIDSMFKCHCKPGFTGDGHHCRDIDECSDSKLNRCDSRTSTCTNSPGGYECRCRRGFRRPVQEVDLDESSQVEAAGPVGEQQNVTSMQLATGTPKWNAATVAQTTCVDINECLDGKLNRCHPQARCTNLRGSYRCQCKRGYLGNGFECHKWFSSDPKVAAYLHRHSAANGSAEPGTKAVQSHLRPLSSLNDFDGDQQDDSDRRDEEEVDESDDDVNEEDGDEEPAERVPKLSEARWEPLQASAPNLALSQQKRTETDQANQASGRLSASDSSKTDSSGPNTRTMFFQPPPARPSQGWLDEEPAGSGSGIGIGSSPGAGQSSAPNVTHLAGAASINASGEPNSVRAAGNAKLSDTNDPVYIQQSSQQTVYQEQSRQTPLTLLPVDRMQTSAARQASGLQSSPPQTGNPIKAAGSAYKRGTIIASATTSPNRAHGAARSSAGAQYASSSSANSLASSSINRNNRKSNALGVVSAASAGQASPICSIWGPLGFAHLPTAIYKQSQLLIPILLFSIIHSQHNHRRYILF